MSNQKNQLKPFGFVHRETFCIVRKNHKFRTYQKVQRFDLVPIHRISQPFDLNKLPQTDEDIYKDVHASIVLYDQSKLKVGDCITLCFFYYDSKIDPIEQKKILLQEIQTLDIFPHQIMQEGKLVKQFHIKDQDLNTYIICFGNAKSVLFLHPSQANAFLSIDPHFSMIQLLSIHDYDEIQKRF